MLLRVLLKWRSEITMLVNSALTARHSLSLRTTLWSQNLKNGRTSETQGWGSNSWLSIETLGTGTLARRHLKVGSCYIPGVLFVFLLKTLYCGPDITGPARSFLWLPRHEILGTPKVNLSAFCQNCTLALFLPQWVQTVPKLWLGMSRSVPAFKLLGEILTTMNALSFLQRHRNIRYVHVHTIFKEKHWKVLTVANNRYFIGNFDGTTFTAIDDVVIYLNIAAHYQRQISSLRTSWSMSTVVIWPGEVPWLWERQLCGGDLQWPWRSHRFTGGVTMNMVIITIWC